MCTSIASWRTQVETIATDAAEAITKPGATRDTLEGAIDDGVEATETLLEDLRAAVPPDTSEGGRRRRRSMRSSTTCQLPTTRSRPHSRTCLTRRGWPQIVAALSGLATNLQTTVESGRTLVTELTELGGAMKDAFENADSCQELREPE